MRVSRTLRILAAATASLLAVPAVAWWTFPLWAPSVASHFLPDGWSAESLQMRRPGWRTIDVPLAQISGPLEGFRIDAKVRDATVAWPGPTITLGTLSIRIDNPAPTPAPAPSVGVREARDLALPRFAIPGTMPTVRIRRFELAESLGLPPLQLDDLLLAPDTALHLTANMPANETIRRPLTIEAKLETAAIEISAVTDPGPGPALSLRYLQDNAPADESASARLTVQGDLQVLNPATFMSVFQPVDLGELRGMAGPIDLDVRFAGVTSLAPVAARLESEGLELETSQARLGLSLDVSAVLTGDDVSFEVSRLTASAHGQPVSWLGRIRQELGQAGIEGMLHDAPLTLELASRGVLQGAVSLGSAPAAWVSGGLTLTSDQEAGHTLRAELTELQWRDGQPAGSAQIERFTAAGIAIGPELATLDSLATEGHLSVRGGGVEYDGHADIQGVSLPAMALSMDRLAATVTDLELPSLSAGLRLVTTGLRADDDGLPQPGLDVDLTGRLTDGARLEGQGTLLAKPHGALPFEYRANLDDESADVTLRDSRLPATALAGLLGPLGVSLPEALTMTSGELVIDGSIRLHDASPEGKLQVRSPALGLAFGDSEVEGLTFEAGIDVADVLSGAGSLQLTLVQLAAGLDMDTLSGQFEATSNGDLTLSGVSAYLLDGHVELPSLRLSDGKLDDTALDWRGLSLGRLLAFIDVAGLDGQGTLDARAPIVSDGDGVAVQGGTFRAREAGVLRYRGAAGASNIGLQALENFQYQSLEGRFDYASDGAYRIGLDLLGQNPDVYGGHPIRLRLNIDGELPAMFRSLFVTGDFESAIIDQISTGQAPTP